MLIIPSNTKTAVELELKFLRHLAWRAYHDNGIYLSQRDIKALEFLNSQHSQDVSSSSVAHFAIEEFKEMNPHIEITE